LKRSNHITIVVASSAAPILAETTAE
jgi:hypothetical protein